MSFKEKVPMSLVVLAETEKALQCEQLTDQPFWLPKSQIDYDEEQLELGKVLEISIPRWLIKEKGLVE